MVKQETGKIGFLVVLFAVLLACSGCGLIADAKLKQGLACLNAGRFEEAVAKFDKAIELLPHSVSAYDNRGIAYARMGRLDLALLDFDKSIEINPNSASSYCNRGFAYYLQGNTDKAIEDFNKAAVLAPDAGLVYENRARAYFQKKDYAKSWEDVRKAVFFNNGFFNKAAASPGFLSFIEELKKASGQDLLKVETSPEKTLAATSENS